jgi:hypothetical protein
MEDVINFNCKRLNCLLQIPSLRFFFLNEKKFKTNKFDMHLHSIIIEIYYNSRNQGWMA